VAAQTSWPPDHWSWQGGFYDATADWRAEDDPWFAPPAGHLDRPASWDRPPGGLAPSDPGVVFPNQAPALQPPPWNAAEVPYEPPPARQVGYAGSTSDLPGVLPFDAELGTRRKPDLPPGTRHGFFQKAICTTTWLAGDTGVEDLGMFDVDLKTALALPLPSRESPLLLIPGFSFHFLDGPVTPDLPPQLYDAYMMFRWMPRLGPRWKMDLAVTPGIFSDFKQDADEGLRITGHGFVVYDWMENCKFVLGANYLDRDDIDVLPIAGVIWEPNPAVKLDLVFPRPKIACRLFWDGRYGDDVQDWLYLAGEFGEGVWAIERASGLADQVTYRDIRVILGLERKRLGRVGWNLELGYVFGRRLDYQSPTPRVEPGNTWMLRGGLTY
jgi:hypothetical protein